MSAASALPSPIAAVELRGLVKDFPVGMRGVRVRAVDTLDLRVAPGQVYGLLGPNGSGKSTTIKLILGLLRPTAGECAIFSVPSLRVEARADVGYLPESPHFYRHLTGRELVRLHGRLGGIAGRELADRSESVIATVGLTAAADRRIGTYSKGMLQRIGLAQAIVHDPRLVILDEPVAGVDVCGVEAISELILQLKVRGKTVLVTSHQLPQIEEICDRVAILDRGRLVLEGLVRDLAGGADRQALVMAAALSPDELAELRAWLAAKGRRLESVERPRARIDRIVLESLGRTARES